MKIDYATELMKNQKHAVIMAPDKQFEVLQTQEGHSLFFSIGTDQAFYCTREIPADKHGWSRINFTDILSKQLGYTTIAAKHFDVAQNLESGTMDIAFAATADGSDSLFISFGNKNTADDWTNNPIVFTEIKFDDTSHNFSPLFIAGVYISQSGGNEFLVVDVLANVSSNTIFRYFVDPAKKTYPTAWHPHDLSGNLEAGSVTNRIGRKAGNGIDAMYTMGINNQATQLLYTPLYNARNPDLPPVPTKISLPPGATAMALSFPDGIHSDLFVAAGGSLYFLDSTQQEEDQPMTAVCTHPLLNEVTSLHVNNNNATVIVWGLNQQGQIFYLKSVTGNELTSSAWSYPVPIMENVNAVASFVNNRLGNTAVFASTTDNFLHQLMQDAATTLWRSRSIVLPSTKIDDYIQTHTYTTHINCMDDSGVPLNGADVTITATETCSVYINDYYHLLHASVPLQVKSDISGVINITQPIDSIGSVCYHIHINDGKQTIDINPMLNVLGSLKKVQTDKDFPDTVKNEKGESGPLVDPEHSNDKSAAASHISGFSSLQDNFPANGKQAQLKPGAPFDAGTSKITIIHFNRDGIRYYEGAEQAASIGFLINADHSFTFRGAESTQISTGDAWQWLKNLFLKLEEFILKIIDGITHFVMTIAGEIYHFAIACISDIMQGIQFVLSKLEVVLEKIVQWVGHIFGWDDVIRTHKVLKSLFVNYANHCLDNLEKGSYQQSLADLTQSLVKKIDDWAGVPTDSYQQQAAAGRKIDGQNNPSCHWVNHHAKGNMENANPIFMAGIRNSAMGNILTAISNECNILGDTSKQLQDVIKGYASVSTVELIKQIIGVISDALVKSLDNALTALLNNAAILLNGIVKILDAPLNIPVLSPLYKIFSEGSELSLLDLACLVAAIPVTFIYKIINHDKVPFPDDDVTRSLIDAPDLKSMAAICFPKKAHPAHVSIGGNSNVTALDSISNKIVFSGNISALFGGIAMALAGSAKSAYEADTKKSNRALSIAVAVIYLPYIAPDILQVVANLESDSGGWYDGANAFLAAIGLFKTFLDIPFGDAGDEDYEFWAGASPYYDFMINLAWQVPTTFAYLATERKAADITGLVGNTCFNASGILSPAIALSQKNVELQAGLIVAAAGLNIAYGLSSGLVAALQNEG